MCSLECQIIMYLYFANFYTKRIPIFCKLYSYAAVIFSKYFQQTKNAEYIFFFHYYIIIFVVTIDIDIEIPSGKLVAGSSILRILKEKSFLEIG